MGPAIDLSKAIAKLMHIVELCNSIANFFQRFSTLIHDSKHKRLSATYDALFATLSGQQSTIYTLHPFDEMPVVKVSVKFVLGSTTHLGT